MKINLQKEGKLLAEREHGLTMVKQIQRGEKMHSKRGNKCGKREHTYRRERIIWRIEKIYEKERKLQKGETMFSEGIKEFFCREEKIITSGKKNE